MIKKNSYAYLQRVISFVCLLSLPLLLLNSCRPDDEHFAMPDEMKVRVFERLQSDPDYSTFVKGVEKAGLKDILQRSGLYTAFAPTNAAWDAYLQANGYSSIESIPDTILIPLINYHFMEPMKFSFDFKEPTRYTTRANRHLRINREGENFTVNGVQVLADKMNGEAMNGAIHGIPEVLVALPTLEEAIKKRQDLKTFARLLKTFTLRRYDDRSSPRLPDGTIDSVFVEESLITGFWWRNQTTLLTAFAPTDAAFTTFLEDNGYASFGEVPRNVLELVIMYHFLEGAKKMAELTDNLETIGEEKLTVNAADISTPDIALNNGYLHVTNKLFLPPSLSSLTGIIYLNRDKDLSMFATAVQKAAVAGELSDATKQFTVFAPTNAAFTAANIDVTKETGDILAKIVRFHIINSKKMSAELTDQEYETMHDSKTIKVSGSTVTGKAGTTTANIIQVDKVATNGVLHKLDAVLKSE
jgi:transforming growth factor-beta-induced protein